MSSRSPVLVVAVVAAALAAAGLLLHRATGATTTTAGGYAITDAVRAAGPRFAADVSAGDRAWIEAAIARARPEARALIDEVDGLVTFTTAGGWPAMGLTRADGYAFTVWLNVARLNGTRTIDRDTTVLHELGHVVDLALVDDALDRRLDDGIPRGGPCDEQDGVAYGGCAAPEERIADTFAKWALGGSVSAIGAGYAIAAPASLEDWGAPLGALGRSLRRR